VRRPQFISEGLGDAIKRFVVSLGTFLPGLG
jgi:hypothetical protein